MAELSADDPIVDTPDTITWPMLPGDSVNRIAALFYPGNKPMQRRFVAKTLKLSHELYPNLNPAETFAQPATLIVPELRALSSQAKPFKAHRRHSGKTLKLRMSYKIQEQVTPEMQAKYEDLSSRNQAMKQDLERLNLRLSDLQLNLDQLKLAAENNQVTKQIAVSVFIKAPAPESPVSPKSPPPANMPPLPPHRSVEVQQDWMDSAWVMLLVQFLMLVLGLILAIFVWRWLRKRMARQLEDKTDKQMDAMHKNALDKINAPLFDLNKVETSGDVDPGILSVEEIDSVVEEARIFVSMDRVNEAKSLLTSYIEELPKAALAPWLYLMDIYRDENQKDEFIALAKRFHQTFNVMAPQWEDVQVAMVVAKSLEEFPHIVSQLLNKWAAGQAKPYLEELLSDNREGERTGFSLEVLEEIMTLQGLLEIRDEISVQA
ncbi:MAG TPA: hypothetical protein VIE91_01840 [Methylophilaceae bacterium]